MYCLIYSINSREIFNFANVFEIINDVSVFNRFSMIVKFKTLILCFNKVISKYFKKIWLNLNLYFSSRMNEIADENDLRDLLKMSILRLCCQCKSLRIVIVVKKCSFFVAHKQQNFYNSWRILKMFFYFCKLLSLIYMYFLNAFITDKKCVRVENWYVRIVFKIVDYF